MDAQYFPHVSALLSEVRLEYENGDYASMTDCLNAYIRKRKYWPMVQTKKYFGKNNLVLLHNTYIRTDVEHFQALYDEVRSVVLDLDAPEGENIIVSLADKTPERLTPDQYLPIAKPSDRIHECFEGTMVYVYHYKDQWYFSTTTCPTVNSSKYFHPTKTHGIMLDEALSSLFPDATRPREQFVTHLNPDYSYGFLIVHHENKHVMDYTDFLGENYKTLYHLFTRYKKTSESTTQDLSFLGIQNPQVFSTPDEAIEELVSKPLYGIIVRTEEGNVYRVSTDEILTAEKENMGNSNPWMNMLNVYMQQNPKFKINDYLAKYQPNKDFTLYSVNGQPFAPVYIIHTAIMTLRDILFQAYDYTTTYDPVSKKYHLYKEFDEQYPAIIRFHLAQLRHLQITKHRHAPLSQLFVYHYLCLHQTMKNIRMLIQHIANEKYILSSRTIECFNLLNQELHA